MKSWGMCVVSGAVAVGLLAGCGAKGTATARASGPAGDVTSTRKSFDPPTRFQQDRGVKLPSDVQPSNSVLYQRVLFVGQPDRLMIVDADTGRVRATLRPDCQPLPETSQQKRPALAQVQGRTIVLAAFACVIPGKGTTPDDEDVKFLAIDADTQQQAWTVTLGSQDGLPKGVYNGKVTIFGVQDDILVFQTNSATTTLSTLDLTTRKLLWTQQLNRIADAFWISGSTIIGNVGGGSDAENSDRVIGWSIATGRQRWEALPHGSIFVLRDAGPHLVAALGGGAFTDNYFDLLDSDTGEVKFSASGRQHTDQGFMKHFSSYSSPETFGDTLYCWYDDRSMTVCRGDDDWFAVFDAKTGSFLWDLPNDKENRSGMSITTAWHGVLYGYVRNDSPLVIDLRSRADPETAPGIAPDMVNGYVGINYTKDRKPIACPATG